MKIKLLVLLFLFIFSSCCYSPKCVNVCYMHEENSRIVDWLWFEGKLYDGNFVWKGRVADLKLISDTRRGLGERGCKENKANIEDGFYSVFIPIPSGGEYILNGHGYGSTIYIHPNQLSKKHFEELKSGNK